MKTEVVSSAITRLICKQIVLFHRILNLGGFVVDCLLFVFVYAVEMVWWRKNKHRERGERDRQTESVRKKVRKIVCFFCLVVTEKIFSVYTNCDRTE